MNNYSNLPLNSKSNLESTIQAFDAYYSQPIELNATAYAAIVGFFTNKGFQQVASESISTIIMTQAKKDGYNPLKIIDTLKGLSDVEISGIVAEILNYNRLKTSSLGTAQAFTTNKEIQRNILGLSPYTIGNFTAIASTSSINEGGTINFLVTTTNVTEGTSLYWDLYGTNITEDDFNETPISGTVTLEGSTFTISKTLSNDVLEEGPELLNFRVRKGSLIGPVVATTSTIINDTSRPFYDVYASTSTVSEGSTVTFTIITQNVPNNTQLFWRLLGTASAADISPTTTNGIAIIVSNSATVSKTILADLSTEGTENLIFEVTKISDTSTVKASTSTNIDDTSREILDVNVTWSTVQSGIVAGPQPGGWSITNSGRRIRFNVQDSANCAGPNSNIQSGIATATIVTFADAYKFNPTLSGFGEAEDPGYENMYLYLNGVLIRRATSVGGNLACFPSVPVNQIILVPGPYIIPPFTTATFVLQFTTSDALYHVGAYYELDMIFEKYEP